MQIYYYYEYTTLLKRQRYDNNVKVFMVYESDQMNQQLLFVVSTHTRYIML